MCLSYREHHEIDVWWENFVSSLECYFAQQREKEVQGQANAFCLLEAVNLL